VRRTIYNTPVVRQIFWLIAWLLLKCLGWKLEGKPPTEKKYVLIAVPHTTNWDFPITLAMAFIFKFDIFWMGKDSLFKGVLGPIMRWMGGIPINRKSSNNVVQQTIEAFNRTDGRLVITIPPEGTRSKVNKWKTGFYYIAVGAKVPIGMGFLDYKRKVGGFGPTFYPTGDIEKDIPEMRKFYANISGKYAEQCHID
jgi:1-acyl-sn-glycerol-3-phosphate acyltransferase